MKIKTLLIAAATLAVGAITSQAQVYSQNIVGYATIIYPAGQFIMSANPLTTGNDVLTNVFQGVPGGSTLNYWTGSTWATYTYSAGGHIWKNGAANVSNTNLPPGLGFFFNASSSFTNTFTGTIVANTGGGKATNALPTGIYPVGSLVPYADTLTNASTVNLTVPGGSTIQVWNPTTQQFTLLTYSAGGHVWKNGSVITNYVLNVGQGFFISPGTTTNWVQTLQ